MTQRQPADIAVPLPERMSKPAVKAAEAFALRFIQRLRGHRNIAKHTASCRFSALLYDNQAVLVNHNDISPLTAFPMAQTPCAPPRVRIGYLLKDGIHFSARLWYNLFIKAIDGPLRDWICQSKESYRHGFYAAYPCFFQ